MTPRADSTLHQTSHGPGTILSAQGTHIGKLEQHFNAPAEPKPKERYDHQLPSDAHAGFIGRREMLKALTKALKPGKKNVVHQSQALHADGGVGKTTLAVHLGRKLYEDGVYDYVLFLAATAEDRLRSEVRSLCAAPHLNLPAQMERDEEKQFEAVIAFLRAPQTAPRTLLILDGADDEAARAAVDALRAKLEGCAFLITSRLAQWGKNVQAFFLDIFSTEEARDFLRERLKDVKTDAATLDAIASELDHLPLALEIMASYLRSARMSPQEWLREWRSEPQETFAHHQPAHLHYPVCLGRVWEKSLARLSAGARQLLHVLACIAPRPALLPLEPLEALPQWKNLKRELGELADASLIHWDSTSKTLYIHRLLQTCTRLSFRPEEVQTALSTALAWMQEILPSPEWSQTGWALWQRLEAHVQALLAHTEQETHFEPKDTALSFTLNHYAIWLYNHAQHASAEPLYRRALRIDEASFGPNHPNVAVRLNNLATLLQATNRLAEAEEPMRRALRIDEASYGPDHPNVARDLNNLAQLLQDTNRLAEAEEPMRRALRIDEASYGPDHPKVAIRLNNLAQLLQDTNRLAEAEEPMRRVVDIFEKSLGPDHPNVATALNNLAQLLQATNRLAEAEEPMRRALRIDEASYGPDHPKVAIRLNNLAQLLQATNRLVEAEEPMRRHLVIFARFTAQTGHAHPHLKAGMNNYAGLLLESVQPKEEAFRLVFSALAEGGMTEEQVQKVLG